MAGKSKTPPLYLHPPWSEAKFRQHLKSSLRKASQHWPPINEALKRVERKVETGEYYKTSGNPKMKTQHQCEKCLQWFDQVRNKKDKLVPAVEVDHIQPIGGFSDDIQKWSQDLGEMYRRALVSAEELMCLCPECHKEKTDQERKEGKWKR